METELNSETSHTHTGFLSLAFTIILNLMVWNFIDIAFQYITFYLHFICSSSVLKYIHFHHDLETTPY